MIAILGVLSGAVVIAINPTKRLQQSRDTKRKSDIGQIRQALEAYYIEFGEYPPQVGAWAYSTTGSNWIPALISSENLKSVPVDPINNAIGPWNLTSNSYSYAYISYPAVNGTPNQRFDLVARLENTTDPDRCELKCWPRYSNASWCQSVVCTSTQNYSGQIYAKNQSN